MSDDWDDEKETRCWVTLRVAVSIYGEEPNDENVRDALVATVEQDPLGRDHIQWGVEGSDAEEPALERPRVEFEWEWTGDDKTTDLTIHSEAGHSVVVPISEPFEIERWRDLFEGLGLFITEDEEGTKSGNESLPPEERERLRRQGIAASVDPSERFGHYREPGAPGGLLVELTDTPQLLSDAELDRIEAKWPLSESPPPPVASEHYADIHKLLAHSRRLKVLKVRDTPVVGDRWHPSGVADDVAARASSDDFEPCAVCGSTDLHPRPGCLIYRTQKPQG